MSRRRVVVTGLGLVAPVGNNVDEGWDNVRNGVSGISLIEHFDVNDFVLKTFDPFEADPDFRTKYETPFNDRPAEF